MPSAIASSAAVRWPRRVGPWRSRGPGAEPRGRDVRGGSSRSPSWVRLCSPTGASSWPTMPLPTVAGRRLGDPARARSSPGSAPSAGWPRPTPRRHCASASNRRDLEGELAAPERGHEERERRRVRDPDTDSLSRSETGSTPCVACARVGAHTSTSALIAVSARADDRDRRDPSPLVSTELVERVAGARARPLAERRAKRQEIADRTGGALGGNQPLERRHRPRKGSQQGNRVPALGHLEGFTR